MYVLHYQCMKQILFQKNRTGQKYQNLRPKNFFTLNVCGNNNRDIPNDKMSLTVKTWCHQAGGKPLIKSWNTIDNQKISTMRVPRSQITFFFSFTAAEEYVGCPI